MAEIVWPRTARAGLPASANRAGRFASRSRWRLWKALRAGFAGAPTDGRKAVIGQDVTLTQARERAAESALWAWACPRCGPGRARAAAPTTGCDVVNGTFFVFAPDLNLTRMAGGGRTWACSLWRHREHRRRTVPA